MDFLNLIKKKINILLCTIICIINLILLIYIARSLPMTEFILASIFIMLSCGLSIHILSRIIYFLICIKKFSFLNSEKSIKSTLHSYLLCLLIVPLFYSALIILIFLDSSTSCIILFSSSIGILINICQNKIVLFNDEFIIYDMRVFYIKDIRDSWICKDCNNINTLKILLSNNETLVIINSHYIDFENLQDFLKERIFISNKSIEYGVNR